MPALAFNHAMIYSRDLTAAIAFYRDVLGFELLEEYRAPFGPVYARLKPSQGDSTIALHLLDKAKDLHPGAIRLYFEVRNLDAYCKSLKKKGVTFSKLPTLMPWGWKHAYLNDPDGHEVSLYWAGAKRLKRGKSM